VSDLLKIHTLMDKVESQLKITEILMKQLQSEVSQYELEEET
jgi:hypothetical protein